LLHFARVALETIGLALELVGELLGVLLRHDHALPRAVALKADDALRARKHDKQPRG
jgi:hypothetical protein